MRGDRYCKAAAGHKHSEPSLPSGQGEEGLPIEAEATSREGLSLLPGDLALAAY